MQWSVNVLLFAVVVLVPMTSTIANDSLPSGDDLAISAATVDGERYELQRSESDRLTVVCFLGTECPLARLYGPRLQVMFDQLADQGVRFVGVFSNQQDSPDEIRAFAAEYGLRFPLVKDEANTLADQYHATRTPEVFVVDSRLAIKYRGRVDDQYLPGISRTAPQRDDLRVALAQLLAELPVAVALTEPAGCLIGRVRQPQADGDVTYCEQVVRILNRQCVECHRDGEIGPFALTDYDEVVGWAEMMVEVVNDRRMPPWHASPDHGEFANARYMSDEEKALLAQWVEDGAPYGDASQLPEPPKFVASWQLPRTPDLIVEMRKRPFVVPADGTVEYQYFVVDPGFTEDRWVTAAQVVPGNTSIVHHSIVFVRPPDGARFRGIGWLGAYVPGQRAFLLPPGRARRIPAGSKLVFQQHYTPNGQTQEDLTRVGMLFGDPDDITHEVLTLVGIDQEFEIPPHAASHTVNGRVNWFPREGELLGIMPHMHLRGKSFRFWTTSSQQQQIILDVPRYDFNWQHVYQLATPLPLDAVDELEFSVTFDNSAANPSNPDPSQHVMWGDQTWEEMAVAFFEVAEPLSAQSQPRSRRGPEQESTAEQERRVERKVERLVNEFFANFDSDDDGVVQRMETPLSFRRFGFHRFDHNGDERLTRDEIDLAMHDRVK